MKRTMKLEFYTAVEHRFFPRQLYKKMVRTYRWRLTAPNGRIILASTEGYARKAGAKKNWFRICEIICEYWYRGGKIEVINGQ